MLDVTALSGAQIIERHLPLDDKLLYFNPGYRFRIIKQVLSLPMPFISADEDHSAPGGPSYRFLKIARLRSAISVPSTQKILSPQTESYQTR